MTLTRQSWIIGQNHVGITHLTDDFTHRLTRLDIIPTDQPIITASPQEGGINKGTRQPEVARIPVNTDIHVRVFPCESLYYPYRPIGTSVIHDQYFIRTA